MVEISTLNNLSFIWFVAIWKITNFVRMHVPSTSDKMFWVWIYINSYYSKKNVLLSKKNFVVWGMTIYNTSICAKISLTCSSAGPYGFISFWQNFLPNFFKDKSNYVPWHAVVKFSAAGKFGILLVVREWLERLGKTPKLRIVWSSNYPIKFSL